MASPGSAAAPIPAPSTAHFQSASLYVGDLNVDVVEGIVLLQLNTFIISFIFLLHFFK